MLAFRQPRWWLLILFIAAEVGFIAAARWQWQRGEFKDRRAHEFVLALANAHPDAVADFARLRMLQGDFAAVQLRGRLITNRVYLHDNRIVDGDYGVDVYVPVAIDGGYVLVNMGWIAADRSRRTPPLVPPLPDHFDARGLIAPAPAAGLALAEGSVPPRLRLNIDPNQIALEAPQLLPMATQVFWPAPDVASPFRRDWQPSGMPADRHRGYALQWASFAVVSLILFLMFHFRRKEIRP